MIRIGSHLSKSVSLDPTEVSKKQYYPDFNTVMTPGPLVVAYKIVSGTPSSETDYSPDNPKGDYLSLVQMLEQTYTYQSFIMSKLSFCEAEYAWIKEVYYKENFVQLKQGILNYVTANFPPWEQKFEYKKLVGYLTDNDWMDSANQSFKYLSNELIIYWLQMRDILRAQFLNLTNQDYFKKLDLTFNFDESDPSIGPTTYQV